MNIIIGSTKRVTSILLMSLMVFVSALSTAHFALAGELDLDDAQNVKLSRFKARETVATNKKPQNYYAETEDEEYEGPEDNSNCGAVDIGNVEQPKPGFGGPKTVDIIITGDIINTGNKCK